MIRIFLAFSVVVWHTPARTFTLLDAQVAVLFFFITSGFYMALTINHTYATRGGDNRSGWRRAFYLSRILRLYPAYLATVAAMVIWFGLNGTPNVILDHPGVPFPAFLCLVLMNVFILGQDLFQTIISSAHLHETNEITRVVLATTSPHFFENIWILVGQAWSLGSELMFYAIAPFIVSSVKRIVACFCIGLAIRWGLIFGLHGYHSTIWGYKFFPATCCLFCLGSLSYHIYPHLRDSRWAKAAGGAITAGFALFVLVSFLRWHAILRIGPGGTDTWHLWLAYLIYALSLPLVFCCWRKNPFDRWVGELSYPLYLVHGAVIGFIFAHSHSGQIMKQLTSEAISVAVAAAVFMLIDRPVDAWRHRHFGVQALAARGQTAREPAIRREWIVLACVLVLIFANTLRLRAFARPELAPPVLVHVDGRYNIVAYDDRLFGVPQADPIAFGAPGYDKDPRLIIGTELSDVEARIARAPNVAVPDVPTLLGSQKHYNIVQYGSRVFGVLQGEPITWGGPDFDKDPQLVIGTTEGDVRAQIANRPNPAGPPTMLGSQENYNIVAYGGRVFGVLQGAPIIWGGPDFEKDPQLIIGTKEDDVRAQIANQSHPPVLVFVDGHYNIVTYAGRVFGVPQGMTINWGAPGYDKAPGLIVGTTQSVVRARIAGHPQ